MSKTVIWGDIHSRNCWQKIVEDNPDADRFISLGDEFDSFDYTPREQLINFDNLVKFKEESDKEVIFLMGNHTHHYLKSVGDSGTSGYQARMAPAYSVMLGEIGHHWQMAYSFTDEKNTYLFTHAGVGETFLDIVFGKDGWTENNLVDLLNDLFIHKPRAFMFNGYEGSGDDVGQTPIWIRPRSLIRDSQKLKKKFIQVVGHTSMKKIDIEGKSTGGRYYFIDTLGTSKQYLIIEDGKIYTNTYE